MIDIGLVIGGMAGVGAIPPVTVLGLRRRDRGRWLAELEPYRLQFPRDLDLKDLGAFLDGLSGLLPAAWRRSITVRGLAIDIVADQHGIRHYLVLPRSQTDLILSGLRGALPAVGIVPESSHRLARPTLAGELVTPRPHRQLQVDHPETTSSALLAALQPLEGSESLIVSYLIFPLGYSQAPQGDGQFNLIAQLTSGTPKDAKPSKGIEEKYAHPQFGVVARIGATSESKARDRQLLARLTSAFHASNSKSATLRRQQVSARVTNRALANRYAPLMGYPCRLNSRELLGLLAFPAGGTSLPGLKLGNSRRLAPSAAIPTVGRVIGDSSYPGMVDRPLAISIKDSLTHSYILGSTGSGKSTLMANLFYQDVAAGYGALLFDPKNDLADQVGDLIALGRDVIFIDPTDDFPVGLWLFAGGVEDPELVSERILSVLHRIYAASWGPRTDHILRHFLIALVQMPGATFTDLARLLVDSSARRQLVARLDEPISLEPFFAWFEAMSEGERASVIGPVANKLSSVAARPRLRRILGRTDSTVDFDDVLASGKIVVIKLSAGTLGEDAAALLSSFLLQMLWTAIQRRIRLPQTDRKPVFVYLDEFQTMTNLASPLPEVLSQSRALGVGFTLANQHLGQLDRETTAAVLANCRSQIYFQTSAADARTLAPYVSPALSAQDIQGLGTFEFVARLAGDGSVQPPATGRTRPAPAPLGHEAELRQISRERYGRAAAEIDAEQRQRQQESRGTGPVGRQRRPK